ncbi:hypothetical protein ABE61_18805 [Lysinibacillus sphaericus]|uniref:hypothetical protein n=1 Tax=Lysinibacillus sphaericus TaxID=1421 RepID=UPI0018CCF7D5|nr:hypothetical protein [Lysinibacillus sphaericus]MBG9456035.1 hypothetical protein [Lysinibacillus sphaericus]MBG9479322.1 hypothetical protein [Lysinibacillus sphaericus]MBG9593423.1 hypothetical protein [Lysinibacillus sphaericus]
MFEVKSHSFVAGGIQHLSKGFLHYYIEQPYMEHRWTLIAYNILSKYISDGHNPKFQKPNNVYLNGKAPNEIKIQCNVFPSMGKINEIIDATHEFEFYKGNEKIEEVMFYTVFLQTAFTDDIRTIIIKNLMPEIITGNKMRTILLAIVTPGMEWHIGIIKIEETIRVFKFLATSIGIQVDVFQNREDILDLIKNKSSDVF